VDPGARKETLERVEQGVLIESGRDLASESAAIRSLEGLGLIRSLGVELPDGGAWLRFMGRDVPRLLEQGWRIEIAESERRRWLDVGLGVDVDGEPGPAAAPGGSGAALPGRFLVTHAGPDGGRGDAAGTARGRLILMPAGRLRPILSTLIELYDPQRSLRSDGRLRLSGLQAAQLTSCRRRTRG